MPNYKYKVRDKFGKLITGAMAAKSKEFVGVELEKMGFVPITVEEQKEQAYLKFFEKFNRVKKDDLNLFTRQMVTLLQAGVPIISALQNIEKQTASSVLKRVVGELISDVESGNSFSEALARHSDTFEPLYANTVKAGEVSGMMDEILDRLADLGEHEADTGQKIKVATRYPILAFCALIVGFFIMATFVLPKFVTMFSKYGTELPLPTVVMMKMNYFVTNYWYLAILIFGSIVFGVVKAVNTKTGRKFWDRFTLNMPVFGPLITILLMSRFARIMSFMVKSGVPMLEVLNISARTVGNTVIEDAILSVEEGVKQGKSIAEPMRVSGVFSPIVLQMVSIGEESGKLDELLLRVSDYYDKQSDYMIKNLSTLIEPIFIVVLAVGVLFLALSVFLPMWNMYGTLAGH